jgi:curved DNA-binding protein CbpA
MKKINEYRKLLGVAENAELKDLKTIYRNLMKDWHPDKFQHSHEHKHLAEEKSKHIIEAYHFLVSIAPETRVANFAAYTLTTTTVGIESFDYKSSILQINFLDGSSYEYFAVPKALYIKFVNAPAPGRFARRHIYGSFIYRSFNKQLKAEPETV